MQLPWRDGWFQLLLLVFIAGDGWLAYQHRYALISYLTGQPQQPMAEVRTAIAQADISARLARLHADIALHNQALARQSADEARQAANKAEQGVAGYARLVPMQEDGKTAYAYEGQIDTQRQPSGQVVVNLGEGVRYEGGWKDSVPDGYGIMSYADGRIHSGKWVGGTNTGERVTVNLGGVTWEGEMADGAKSVNSVMGVLVCARDEACRDLAGSFEVVAGSELKLNGPGVERMKDGRTIKAIWKHGVQEGYGAILDANDHIVEQGLYDQGSL